jgi:hypothetical protein
VTKTSEGRAIFLPACGLKATSRTVDYNVETAPSNECWRIHDCSFDLLRASRGPVTALAPPDYKALHPIGAAPVIADCNLVLGAPSAERHDSGGNSNVGWLRVI